MRRRDFLYNAGLLLPAVLLSPRQVMASAPTITTPILIIHNEAADVVSLTSALKGKTQQLCCKHINNIAYTPNGFVITTTNNTIIETPKLVVQVTHQLQGNGAPVVVIDGKHHFQLAAVSTNNERPLRSAYWFLSTRQFPAKAPAFINSNKHTVVCLQQH
jgi:hypothetical protein